jgi:energy-coupling factor transporter ATP-binding protein EcfA2
MSPHPPLPGSASGSPPGAAVASPPATTITSVSLRGLRGIARGRLECLTALTILVGKNGSGKSTLLDALHIAVSDRPAEAVGHAIRHRDLPRGGRWLLHRAEGSPEAALSVTNAGGQERAITLAFQPLKKGALVGQIEIGLDNEPLDPRSLNPAPRYAYTQLKDNNDFVPSEGSAPQPARAGRLPPYGVRYLDLREGKHHHAILDAHSTALEQGAVPRVVTLLREVIPGLRDFRLSTTAKYEPIPMLDFGDHALPAALAGDGAYALIRLAFELCAQRERLVLLEEPEVHQHPAALRRTAQLLRAAAERGTQVVLSTHSLDLIDFVLREAAPEQLAQISVHRLDLRGGELAQSRWLGSEAYSAQDELLRDLR